MVTQTLNKGGGSRGLLSRISWRHGLPDVSLGYGVGLVVSSVILISLGLLMVASASLDVAAERYANPYYFVSRQCLHLLLGLFLAYGVSRTPTHIWQRYAPVLCALGLFLLILVLIPGVGHTVNGSTRWISLGAAYLQVSEPVKWLLVIYLASYIVRRQAELQLTSWGFIKPLLLTCLAVLLLLAEPDFGASVVLLTCVLGMLFVAGANLRIFFAMVLCLLILAVCLMVFEPYRWQRITAFMDPWSDQFNAGYQLTQSLIAVGRGGLTGVGLGESVQKLFYLPEAHTDFVFAVLAEELGLLGNLLVLVCFVVLLLCIIGIAQTSMHRGGLFAGYVCLGTSFLIGIQALINIGVNLGLLPTKGLTLPLMSYGGSSLVVCLCMLGFVLRAHHENRNREARMRKPGGVT